MADCSSSRSTAGTTPARRRPARCAPCASSSSSSPIAEVDPEVYFDYQFNRPDVAIDDDGNRVARVAERRPCYGPASTTGPTGHAARAARHRAGARLEGLRRRVRRRSRSPRTSADRLPRLDARRRAAHPADLGLRGSSENAAVRDALDLERSTYEGPVGILSVLADAAERAGIPTAVDLGVRAALRAQRAVAQGDARAPRPARGPHRRRRSPAATSSRSRGVGERHRRARRATTRTWPSTSAARAGARHRRLPRGVRRRDRRRSSSATCAARRRPSAPRPRPNRPGDRSGDEARRPGCARPTRDGPRRDALLSGGDGPPARADAGCYGIRSHAYGCSTPSSAARSAPPSSRR